MSHSRNASDRMAEAWRRHERRWRSNRYVYAVVSRRSRGLSIGINLNPGKECCFDCVYCQVDRSLPRRVAAPHGSREVDFTALEAELITILEAERSGALYAEAPYSLLLPAERGVRDIAFSGNGEPTMNPRFGEGVGIAAGARRSFGLEDAGLILLTNAARFHMPSVRRALDLLYKNGGEVWAKLDAGTEKVFQRVNRSPVSFERVLSNILNAARVRPVVIQSLWLRLDGREPQSEEVSAFAECLKTLVEEGAGIRAVHLYTIARDPAERTASPLGADALHAIADEIHSRAGVSVEVFP